MGKNTYRYIYGPVPSWRLGSSLGVDPISQTGKICTFDCIYCQIGKTGCLTGERRIFVPTEEIIKEIASLPPLKIDYITFSGRGEPALAGNLGEMLRAVKQARQEKTAVLTNSSLIYRDDVMNDIFPADFIACKLDAPSQYIFERINCPVKDIRFDAVIRSMKYFRSRYKGKLALQIMFMEENRIYAKELAQIAGEIGPDEVQLNTPLRPCGVKPLAEEEMAAIEGYFKGMNVVSVYRAEKIKVEPISPKDTLRRRGKA